MLSLTLVPQVLIFVGNWLGAVDGSEWLRDNAKDLGRILLSSVLASIHLASVGLAIAMFAKRRAFALIAVIGVLMLSTGFSSVVVSLVGSGWAGVVMLLTPISVLNAATLFIFDAIPAVAPMSGEGDWPSQVAYADLPGVVWLLAILTHSAAATYLAILRYRKVKP